MFRVAVGGRLGGVSVERAASAVARARAPPKFGLFPWPIARKEPCTRAADVKLSGQDASPDEASVLPKWRQTRSNLTSAIRAAYSRASQTTA